MARTYSRRHLLQASSLFGIAALGACDNVALPGFAADQPPPPPAAPQTPTAPVTPAAAANGDAMVYEIQYSDAEWQSRLTPLEYRILRQGGTENKHSSPLTRETRPGTYACRGCDLPIYDGGQKVILDIGWVFFNHSFPDTVLTGIDNGNVEAHCRRCGGHFGHILYVENRILHCINGNALKFQPAPA